MKVSDKLDEIQARGTLLVGVTETSPPFSFRDGEKGVVGYDVDLAAAVAEHMRLRMEKVVILNRERISALQTDKVDLVATGMTRSPERAREINFSLAYLVSPHQVLVRNDSGLGHYGDLAGRRLALVRSASVVEELMRDLPTLKIVFFDHYQAAFDALSRKEVDAFFADGLLVLTYAHRSGSPQDYSLLPGYEDGRTAGFRHQEGRAAADGAGGHDPARARATPDAPRKSSTPGSRRCHANSSSTRPKGLYSG